MPQGMLHHPTMAVPDEAVERRRTAGWPDEAERFADRADAGRALGVAIAGQLPPASTGRTLVLGLPRGGAAVAREIAAALDGDLDVVVTHKLGLPWHPNVIVGAIADEGPPVFDRGVLGAAGLATAALAPAIRRARLEVQHRRYRYRGDRPSPAVSGRTVVVADDGLSAAVVARAAVRSVRAGSPARVIYAAPVCAAETADLLRGEADAVVHLHGPRVFHALGLWYRDFTPVTHDDVTGMLAAAWLATPHPLVPLTTIARAGSSPTGGAAALPETRAAATRAG